LALTVNLSGEATLQTRRCLATLFEVFKRRTQYTSFSVGQRGHHSPPKWMQWQGGLCLPVMQGENVEGNP
jgi:hypothetical protein